MLNFRKLHNPNCNTALPYLFKLITTRIDCQWNIILPCSNDNSNNGRYVFEPISVETLGVFNSSARLLLNEIGKRISFNTGEIRETSFLFQRVSQC